MNNNALKFFYGFQAALGFLLAPVAAAVAMFLPSLGDHVTVTFVEAYFLKAAPFFGFSLIGLGSTMILSSGRIFLWACSCACLWLVVTALVYATFYFLVPVPIALFAINAYAARKAYRDPPQPNVKLHKFYLAQFFVGCLLAAAPFGSISEELDMGYAFHLLGLDDLSSLRWSMAIFPLLFFTSLNFTSAQALTGQKIVWRWVATALWGAATLLTTYFYFIQLRYFAAGASYWGYAELIALVFLACNMILARAKRR